MTTRTKKALVFAAATVVLLAVFTLYARPEMMVALADMMWACFQ
ncbi:MAG: hypothetical protein K0R58_2479 [Ramlibacter sp.]|jgi:hypothetical protein|nr:hypothetical protein [Ramlibacter sp.]